MTCRAREGAIGTVAEVLPLATDGPPVNPFDVIGIGCGPSNLALAIYARERDPSRRCLFVERSPLVSWHSGMLIDSARMQISFLKDLVSLRDPSSPFTFLRYAKAKGRLEHFINLNEFRPTRLEYEDYLRWVAEHFRDEILYGTEVTKVSLADSDDSLFRVDTRHRTTGDVTSFFTRAVVHAGGGVPRVPANVPRVAAVMHSSEFLHRVHEQFDDATYPYSIVVVGAGQSGGEIVEYLLERYEHARVHLVISGYAVRPTDNSPFVNEQFYSKRTDEFFALDAAQRARLAEELRSANYGVMREDLIDRLYNIDYIDTVKGRKRLVIHRCSRLSRVDEVAGGVVAVLEDTLLGGAAQVACDGVVLATGYDRGLDPQIFGGLLQLVVTDECGQPSVSRACRVDMEQEVPGGLYVQGHREDRFGLGDTLLSNLPFRAEELFDDLCGRLDDAAPAAAAPPAVATGRPYPPPQYLEDEHEKLYAVIERYRFATVISARGVDEPVVTHMPLILDRAAGGLGKLYGHLDGANPHVTELLDHRQVLVLFHGPNAYISPSALRSDPLPTWNSMTVHVQARVRQLRDPALIMPILLGISDKNDPFAPLDRHDHRIPMLIDDVVGLEFDIEQLTGRFKLSQDRDDADRRLAAIALADRAEANERRFIEYIVGLTLEPELTNRSYG